MLHTTAVEKHAYPPLRHLLGQLGRTETLRRKLAIALAVPEAKIDQTDSFVSIIFDAAIV